MMSEQLYKSNWLRVHEYQMLIQAWKGIENNQTYCKVPPEQLYGVLVEFDKSIIRYKAHEVEIEQLTAERDAIARENVSQKIAIRESTDMLIKAADELTRMKSETYCAYCGERFQLDDDVASRVSEHIRACQKHPMRKVEAERDAARAEVGMKQDALDSYAQLVDVIAQVLGMDAALPSQSFDEAILGAIIKGKEAITEVEDLKECAHIGANTIQKLTDENAKMREALWWYANRENYDMAGAPGYNQDVAGHNKKDDYGEVAREALI